ncbi:MAG: phosphatidate cytidylyltransferase [archaeon]
MENQVVHELKRQAVHLSGLIFVVLSYYVAPDIILALLIMTFVTILTHCFCRPVAQKFKLTRKISDFIHSFAREEEKSRRIYFGPSTFFVGLILPLAVLYPFDPELALLLFRASAIVLSMGDSFSTAIGKAFGKHKIQYNKAKSWEGFLAGFFAAFAATSLILPMPIVFTISLVGMLVESLPINVNDNLSIPVSVCIILWFLI